MKRNFLNWESPIVLIESLLLFWILGLVFAAKECGTRPQNQNAKIYFGELAKKGEFPWQISLRYNGNPICGGSIISDNWIITAAHCVHDDNSVQSSANEISILIGSLDNSVQVAPPDGKLIQAKRIVSHPGYVSNVSDIALIELEEPIGLQETGDHINAICLGRQEYDIAGRRMIVSGWGGTENDKHPVMLRKATVQLESHEHCKKVYQSIGINIYDGEICATNKPGVCYGDSGGPLQYFDGRWYLMGLVEGGKQCGLAEYPAYYASVPYYLDFIRKVTNLETL